MRIHAFIGIMFCISLTKVSAKGSALPPFIQDATLGKLHSSEDCLPFKDDHGRHHIMVLANTTQPSTLQFAYNLAGGTSPKISYQDGRRATFEGTTLQGSTYSPGDFITECGTDTCFHH